MINDTFFVENGLLLMLEAVLNRLFQNVNDINYVNVTFRSFYLK